MCTMGRRWEGKDSEGGPAGDIPARQRSTAKDQGKGDSGMESVQSDTNRKQVNVRTRPDQVKTQ